MALGLSLVIARAAFLGEIVGPSLAACMMALALAIRANGMHAAAFGALLCAVVALPLCAPTATASAFNAVLAACAMSILHGAGNVPSVIAFAAFLVAVVRWGRDESARSLLVTFFAFDVVRVSRKELNALHTALNASQATAAASASATVALIARMLPRSVAWLVASQPALLDSTRGAAELGAAAEAYSDVALISADLVGFTSLCEFLSAGDALLVLNDVIARLEAAAVAAGATKVRTIGDCFVAACGLGKDADALAGGGTGEGGSGGAAATPAPPPPLQPPPPPQTSARARTVAHAVRAAFAFHAVLEEDGDTARGDALPERLASAIKRLRLRIGIHVGSVTYGVICVAGARTDAWGPAAAVVKDVEHAAPPGGTLLSEEAALALAEHLAAEPGLRGLRVRLEAREGGRARVLAA
jgi:class 3 adenylate cyclase